MNRGRALFTIPPSSLVEPSPSPSPLTPPPGRPSHTRLSLVVAAAANHDHLPSVPPEANPWTGAVHHAHVLPEVVAAARHAREEARRSAAREALRVRWIVTSIWAVVVALVGVLAVVMVRA